MDVGNEFEGISFPFLRDLPSLNPLLELEGGFCAERISSPTHSEKVGEQRAGRVNELYDKARHNKPFLGHLLFWLLLQVNL